MNPEVRTGRTEWPSDTMVPRNDGQGFPVYGVGPPYLRGQTEGRSESDNGDSGWNL